MRILGIDPGSRATGWGLLDCTGGRAVAVEWGVIRPDRDGAFDDRLLQIKQELVEIVRRHRPEQAAVEDQFHARSAASALKLGQVRGVLVVALREEGIAVEAYAPRQVKKAVSGYGAADKDQVARMVQGLFGLAEPPRPHDAADAMAVALCHVHSAGLGTAGASPSSRRLRHPVRG